MYCSVPPQGNTDLRCFPKSYLSDYDLPARDWRNGAGSSVDTYSNFTDGGLMVSLTSTMIFILGLDFFILSPCTLNLHECKRIRAFSMKTLGTLQNQRYDVTFEHTCRSNSRADLVRESKALVYCRQGNDG